MLSRTQKSWQDQTLGEAGNLAFGIKYPSLVWLAKREAELAKREILSCRPSSIVFYLVQFDLLGARLYVRAPIIGCSTPLCENESRGERIRWADFNGEVKKVGAIAAPMVVVAMLQYMMQMVAVVMVGHVDQLSLSSVAIATSLTNVTGFSLLSGLVGGLETLCGQAYGAKQYNKIGIYTCSAIISLLLVCIPVSISWIFLDKFLMLIGQDPLISTEAQKYSVYLIAALFGGAIVKPLVRSLQSQSLTLPLIVTSAITLCFHVPLCWAFVFKFEMGSVGAAVAFSLSNWLYLILTFFYIKFSSSCEKSHVIISKDAFVCVGEFFRFAVPSAVMVCLKWWALEVLILVSGLLPNPKLKTSVLSICLTISTLHFTIQYGFGAAASTRVSNELGAGNPQVARLAVFTTMFLAITEAIIVSISILICRRFIGKVYSSEKSVVSYVASMAPFISLSIVTDSLQAVISGIARGSGWQHIGAYVNLGAFYMFGIPTAVALGFPLHMKAKGLWIGILIGSIIQSTSLAVITGLTDWKKQAIKAKERMPNVTLLVDKDTYVKKYESA
ncbi:protein DETOXIFICATION 14-like [Rutidosis leptorrhynchoides]|uniref:protein DETOXIFICATION 14-like n=1 Tax=Rutidosis leptorrhynchoides TaxID=125765 RepID=UPI003A99E183